ncbi:MAG: hypothetical protein IT286_04860 [Proteobacteria bacterium]|nr:hypothetical protein [Pseudomonadota bacterium]
MKIDANPSVAEFFRNVVRDILDDRKVSIQEMTEFYVVNLLTKAVNSSQENADPNYFESPLAILFGKALEAGSQHERYALLKHLGDQSLFISGFFGESLKGKSVDLDYYIAMGSNAYGCLSNISKQASTKDFFGQTFDELSGKFTSVVEIISEISNVSNAFNNQDILKIYEKWLLTKSQNLLEKLQKMGIQPVDLEKGDVH